MAYWAELNADNKVIQVTIGDDNTPDKGHSWLINNLGGRWVETRVDNYASVGWTYIENVGFYPPQPYESWILDGLNWKAPKEKPEGDFYWDESKLEWFAISKEI